MCMAPPGNTGWVQLHKRKGRAGRFKPAPPHAPVCAVALHQQAWHVFWLGVAAGSTLIGAARAGCNHLPHHQDRAPAYHKLARRLQRRHQAARCARAKSPRATTGSGERG